MGWSDPYLLSNFILYIYIYIYIYIYTYIHCILRKKISCAAQGCLVRRKVCAACADPYAEPYAEPYADGILLESGLMRRLMRRKARKDIDNLARRKELHKATLEQNPYAVLRPSTYVREVSCAGLAPEVFR